MKKKSPPYAIIGAVVLGLIVVVLFVQYQRQQDRDRDAAIAKAKSDADAAATANALNNHAAPVLLPDSNTRPVLYATQPMEPGLRISPASFEKKLTPNDILPAAYTDQTDVVGWYSIRKIEKGDPFTPTNIGKTLPTMSERIPAGMREISLPIFNADVNNAGGYIVDGDRVDLLYTTRTLDNATTLKVETVMQNLSILSVPGSPVKTAQTDGINQVPTPGLPIAVTFQVTPEQAQVLIFLSQVRNGEFSMILRGRKDNGVEKIKPFEVTDYEDGFKKVQKTVDKANERVKELAAKIEAQDEAQKNQGQGNTNETPNPTPPSP